ncbi:hypothetical protein KTO58_05780 [Chitinophaga pendula]|uniref:hypothetical protein n=1 Tax=Chitinophaga TaxID=79328 RepID=UPI000BAF7552|nr:MULTISPECIES: hypothetical protein [Chitinophaga]ASZ13687.1 hypothetical protein CK934_23385 [Chitinophaga sp. MD30]UCJ08696.1 hypothetical protein KTO58_05780 [Chitinophaga pendula]
MRFSILVFFVLLIITACSKIKYDTTDTVYGGLSLYNASYTLNSYLPSSGNQRSIVLPITGDLSQTPLLKGSSTPIFSPASGCRLDFPAINWRYEVPWTVFDHYTPGHYTGKVYLNSTNSNSLLTFPLNVIKDRMSTYFISDSLGTFHSSMVEYDNAPAEGYISLQLIQLCPDADSINMRIGNNLLEGMQNIPYRKVSPIINYRLPADSILKLRVFNGGDTLQVIARTDLPVTSGRAYMIILKHYRQTHGYIDLEGHSVDIVPNASLDIRKVY